MKKITLFMGLALASTMSFAQVIVSLTSVPCNTGLEGTYPYEISEWTLTPDMFLGVNSVSGCLEFIEDGTPGIVGDGIDTDTWTVPAVNNGGPMGVPPLVGVHKAWLAGDTTNYASQDLTGKIAVCYRGFYEFGFKAYNAQLRGASAVIIINHTGDAVGMAAGTYGNLVTIPVIQIGRIAGDDLRVAIESCGACQVMGFIGSKVGLYNNDMGSSIADIVMPNELSVPSNVAVDGTNYPIDLGFWAFNYGLSSQSGVTATVDIVYEGGSSVYNNTSAPLNFAAPASNVVDTQYFDLGVFAPATWNQGEYKITYTLNLPSDEDPADNTYTVDFRVTASTYAKSRTTPGNLPIASTSVSPNISSGSNDFWQPCIVFQSPVVATSTIGGGTATGMTLSASPINGFMTDEILELRAWEWNDVFVDMNTPPTFTSFNQAGSGIYLFQGTPDSLDNIYIPFDVPFQLNNNQRYLFCVYNAAEQLRIGYDAQIDYTSTINNYLQPISPLSVQPQGNAETWYRDGFGWDITPSISVSIDFPTAVSDVEKNISSTVPYPNPATNMLLVPIRKGVQGNTTVQIYDLAGKLVLSDTKVIGNGPLKINVASLANGAYVFNLTFSDGSKDAFKVSVNR